MTTTPTDDRVQRRERYAAAIRAESSRVDDVALADAVMPVVDAELAEYAAENTKLHQWHDEDRAALTEMRATIERLRAAAESHRLALSTALGLGTGAPWDAIRERAAELHAAEERLEAVHATASAWARPDMSEPSRVAGKHLLRVIDGDEAQQQPDVPGAQALRDRIAEALYAHDHPTRVVPLDETGMGVAYRATADAVLAVLPPPADRASMYREAADALWRAVEEKRIPYGGDFVDMCRDELLRLADEAAGGAS